MIQRIQTLYLLAITILGCLTCFMPLIEFTNILDYGLLKATGYNVSTVDPTHTIHDYFWGLLFISILIPVISLITIGLYKKRMLQIRLTILNILLQIGYYAVLGISIWFIYTKYEPIDYTLRIPIVFQLINLVLSWLAIRGIGKDEAKVRAADRIR